MELTTHQNQVLDDTIRSLRANRHTVLTGSAGTGKTTLMNEVVNDINRSLILTATTHEAARQLSEKTGVKVTTIHDYHKLSVRYAADGESTYLVRGKDVFFDKRYVIVDEASMISKELMSFILEDTYGHYLFIGDHKQLPPIKEVTSPVFDSDFPTFTLTEIHRQAKMNDNIHLSHNLHLLEGRTDGKFFNWIDEDFGIIFDLIEDGCTYISWTNKVVNNVNAQFRELSGFTEPYEIGETVILQGPVGKKYHNGQRVEIETLKESSEEFDHYVINGAICVLKKHAYNDWKAACKKLSSSYDWKAFYKLKNKFVRVKHSYAMTVHKSQGSTFDNVILNVTDCMRNRRKEERDKLLYTAITRTSNMNYLI